MNTAGASVEKKIVGEFDLLDTYFDHLHST